MANRNLAETVRTMQGVKVGEGNANLIMDAHDLSLSTDELRRRYKAGDYGAQSAEHVRGWIHMAGRA